MAAVIRDVPGVDYELVLRINISYTCGKQTHVSNEMDQRVTKHKPVKREYIPSESNNNQTNHSRHAASGLADILISHHLNTFIQQNAVVFQYQIVLLYSKKS